jgi:cholesterol oxidase
MRTIYDTIIIGSGFGGSVAAYHLSKTDEKILLLERGPWRNTMPVRSMGINKYSPLPRNKDFYTHVLRNISAWCLPKSGVRSNSKGLFEFHYDKDMSVLCSSSVGGGSHVYTALNVPPAVKGFWDGHVEGVNSQSMEKHCRWMIYKMGAKIPTLNNKLPNNTQCLYKESDLFSVDEKIEQPSMSVAMDPISVRQGNNSFFGSETGSKRTLDDVLLKPALEAGLEINDLIECLDISRCDTLGAKYRIKCFDHQDKRYRYFLTKKVILGAGTLNTLKILFNSQASGGLNTMPSLGKGFSGNGDIIGYWPVNEPGADFTAGAPCHGRVAIRTGKEVNDKLDITQFGFNGFGEIPLPSALKARFKRDLFFVGMGADNADGVVTFNKGRLKIKYIQENNAIYSDFFSAFDSISKRSGTDVKYIRKRLLTVHPLGGAKLAADKNKGVVNVRGEVFDNPGLYIVDAAALPAAPGSAPSMTISAWARHVSQHIIK